VQEELRIEDEEENEECDNCDNNYNLSLCLPDLIPHQYESKKMFLENIEQCTKELYHVPRFCTGLIHHLYCHSEVADKYIHAPLIKRDEMSNKGVMLTNAALLKLAGLVMKQTNGKFILGPNATNQHVFLYGDGLSVSPHCAIYDKILRQITRLSNEDYVGTLLDAQDCIFIQKGAFHQCMHHLASIYTQFYGGFMQPFQVANSVKRVTGNPLKQSAFQCHKQFAIKLYNTCNLFMLCMYVHSCYCIQFHDKMIDSLVRMHGMLEDYRRYRTSWGNNPIMSHLGLFLYI
jgi:hypothetical protein